MAAFKNQVTVNKWVMILHDRLSNDSKIVCKNEGITGNVYENNGDKKLTKVEFTPKREC